MVDADVLGDERPKYLLVGLIAATNVDEPTTRCTGSHTGQLAVDDSIDQPVSGFASHNQTAEVGPSTGFAKAEAWLLTTRAGTPTPVAPGGKGSTTTAPAPTIDS